MFFVDIIEARFRTRDKKNAFQRNLERLKRKKQGKVMSSSEDEGEGEEDQDEELYVSPFKGARPGTIADEDLSDVSDHSAGKDDEEGSDFIVEDNGAGLEQLPIHFSMDSHQDLAHQFKKVFQFFCHIAVQPASARHGYMARQMKHEEYFYVPLEVFRRKLSGLRDSLVASSVWRADFKRKLDTYPEFETVALDFSMPGCHACHLGGRMSTILGRLGGKPYDRLGFQVNLRNDDSSEKETEFNLGRFCAQRTRVYHQFTHWEYALFQSISGDIDEARRGSFVHVAFLGGREPPRDPNDADGFCDWFDEGKVIAMEWRRLREMMDSAQRLEMAAKRGDED
ncbi:hypothetical protein FISHEDRAFT_53228 [Fistulina hepatica ATCC 64428]|nr:hypothetical protein FISHEDRAFT_53228 [Fistulina hepatica ATCC 64428]